MKDEELYMRRALELALMGAGSVSSNPMVGCVIVKGDRIIGEGYHKKFGEAHAEVNAINSVEDKEQLEGAVVYVTLEPCSHQGKTPPCADLLIRYPLKKVVVCNLDPNPLVAGRGIQKIKDAGIEVETGLLEAEGRALNKRFFHWIEKRQPYVILKWAQTADGFIARDNYDSKWISNALSRKLVHKWRSEEDAVLAGTKTVLYDNPQLNVRDWAGRNPIRLFIDKKLEVPLDYHILDNSQKTICYNCCKNEDEGRLHYVKVPENTCFISFILNDLYDRGVQSVIVEGGTNLLKGFIENDLWNEIRVFHSEQTFGSGITAPVFRGTLLADHILLNDRLSIYYPLTTRYSY
ncbi:MAG TPA: bifunctional diaminohydroxyphosphoribosylaminopyrimidine deaminase/5-amino-6-(5-phosphoribosylamino)uracil reductase RibD [Cytophagaceae bacterium]